MATLTTRPDATVANGSSTIGGGAGSRHAALSDNSDTTYVAPGASTPSSYPIIGFAEPSLPGGSVVKQISIRARLAQPTGDLESIFFLVPWAVEAGKFNVNWTSPTTVVVRGPTAVDAADIAAITVAFYGSSSALCRIYELYADTVYVAKPTVTVNAPTGTLTSDNAPVTSWTPGLDSDGGEQTFYEVRVFNDAQYGAGGFSAGSSACVAESGILAGSATSWDVDAAGVLLPNDDYKAYVRVGQTVNGTTHWSNYTASSVFTINVPVPAVPTITLTSDDANARIEIEVDDPGGGAVTTERFQVQRETDDGWVDVRVPDGALEGDNVTIWDYEAPNGATVTYRARAVHGTAQFSAWADEDGSWDSTRQWAKHPFDPEKNVAATFTSQPGHRRPARQGIHQPLNSPRAVVVSDKRGPDQGELSFMVAEEDLATFEELIESNVPILVQAPADHKWDDRWVSFGDVDFSRYVDKAWVEEGLISVPWIGVARPDGDLVAWPS